MNSPEGDALRVFQSARPRGARRTPLVKLSSCTCFNPRAHAGRDSVMVLLSSGCGSFNPRAHAGRDRQQSVDVLRAPPVSIRAPTRGATASSASQPAGLRRFNPRAHAGRDLAHRLGIGRPREFQSARPRGARQRERGAGPAAARVSIRAPTRGATVGVDALDALPRVSIRAPTRGATAARARGRAAAECFNPRAHAGRDSVAVTPRRPKQCCHASADPSEGTRSKLASRRGSGQSSLESTTCAAANLPVDDASLAVRGDQKISGPLRSSEGLAPTCSTFRFQPDPRW